MINYKGHQAIVSYDPEAEIFHGEVINIRDVITFKASNQEEIEKAFQDSVDDYLDFCFERGEKPCSPVSGSFMLKITPELYQKIYQKAQAEGKTINSWVEEKLF